MRFWGVTTWRFPPPPCGKATKGHMIKAESVIAVLSLCAEARGLLSQTQRRPNHWQRQHTSPITWNLTMHPGNDQFAWGNNQTDRGVTKSAKTSEESNHSSEASGATPRPTPGLRLSLDLGRRSPPRPTPGLGLNLDLGGITASPDLGLGPTTLQGGPSLPYP
jgi:hypothetical protein